MYASTSMKIESFNLRQGQVVKGNFWHERFSDLESLPKAIFPLMEMLHDLLSLLKL